MADPTDQIKGVQLHKVTEGIVSVEHTAAQNIDTGNAEKIELTNKGPNTVYLRCDGTTPTSGVAGNADQIAAGGTVRLERGKIVDVKIICATSETATVFFRLFS